jgi:molecular chaperone Hsp33
MIMIKMLKNLKLKKFNIINFKSFSKFFSQTTESPILKDYITKKDHMISGFFKDGSARFVMSDVSLTLKDAQKRFEIYDAGKLEQLGIAYNTSLILNSFLNGEERIKLICQYFEGINLNKDESHMTTIYSESIGTGEVRGFIEESNVKNNELDREKNSFLKISKILYNQKSEVYGIIKLKQRNRLTEEDIFKYFEESEQIRTHVFFKHEINQKNCISQGFILQKMPDCNLEELEKRFFQIIKNKNFLEINKNGLTFNNFMQIFQDLGLEVELRRTPIQFYCRCSKDQFKKVLVGLGREEIEDMKDKNQRTITCKNCNTNYILTDQDFSEIFNYMK